MLKLTKQPKSVLIYWQNARKRIKAKGGLGLTYHRKNHENILKT
jgi:hypothetical protein